MSSVSSVSDAAGLSNWMQVISANSTPAVSALLSSSKVQTALAQAPAADIVQLSDQATQMQMVSSLFGSGSSADSASQMQAANLAQEGVLASAYSVSGAATGTDQSGSLINLLA